MKEKGIIVAQDLTPSDTAKMDMELVLGFVTEEGGVTSHVSIIAKIMGYRVWSVWVQCWKMQRQACRWCWMQEQAGYFWSRKQML